MHSTRKITEDLIYVGGSDRRLSRFENLFPIPRGVSYNSYVLLDDKTVLMDTADESISRQYIENVVHALDGRSVYPSIALRVLYAVLCALFTAS